MPVVATYAEALASLRLPAATPIDRLSTAQLCRFRQLVGWEDGGPVVALPTAEERAHRSERERWKHTITGTGQRERCFLLTASVTDQLRRSLDGMRDLRVWYRALVRQADRVAALPDAVWATVVPKQGPWNVAGSYCPSCYGTKSDRSIYAPRWAWSVHEPERIACPECGIGFPNASFPEDGALTLPRLGLEYRFYIDAAERTSDWRDGRHASRFGGAPTHVSFSGELRRAQLSWALGQVEPLATAYAITGTRRYATAAATILWRLAQVYGNYPLYCYMQEYVDADPGWACAMVDQLPTGFRRGATWFSYDGTVGGERVSWREPATPATSPLTRGEWGAARIAREKAGTGQVFLALLRAYELIHETIDRERCITIEHDLLLEMYLDVKALSRRVDNKSGPGATARVAVGVFYGLESEIEAGVEQFEAVIDGQFYADGSWKETPLYGQKALQEEMWMVPELLRPARNLYQGRYLRALQAYAETATPAGTGPALDDTDLPFQLPSVLRDVAARRAGVHVPPPPRSLAAFGLPADTLRVSGEGYVPPVTQVASGPGARLPLDGPLGFPAVGHVQRLGWRRSLFGLLDPAAPTPRAPRGGRGALNHCYHQRGLGCIGLGRGRGATQLYCNGGDGRPGHRHGDPLGLLLFAGGREVLPDSGYLADHPAAEWARHTAAHNTVVPGDQSVAAIAPAQLAHGRLAGKWSGRWLLAAVDVAPRTWPDTGFGQQRYRYRRLAILLRRPDGLPVLVDVFEVAVRGATAGTTAAAIDWHYVVRAGSAASALAGPPRSRPRQPLFGSGTSTPPWGFRSAHVSHWPVSVQWPGRPHVAAWFGAADELVTFASPAWRSAAQVFAQPRLSWDAVALYRRAPSARFAAVYDVVGAAGALVRDVDMSSDRIEIVTDRGVATIVPGRDGAGPGVD